MDALFYDDTFSLAKYVKLGAAERKARTAEMKILRTAEMKILVAVTAAGGLGCAREAPPHRRDDFAAGDVRGLARNSPRCRGQTNVRAPHRTHACCSE